MTARARPSLAIAPVPGLLFGLLIGLLGPAASLGAAEDDGKVGEVGLESSGEAIEWGGAPDASPAGGPRLVLDDVLASVDAHFPLLRVARDERLAREGERLAASGRFDTRVRATGDLRPAGFYENYAGGAGVEQPTRLWGARFFGGYRIGSGQFPSYEGARLTDGSGEVRGGLDLPLLRGGSIDKPRADLRRSEIDLLRVEPDIALQRIDYRLDATMAYWSWLAAGQRVSVAKRLLEVAESRQSQIARRVERGAEPRIDLVDNQRMIVDRQLKLRGAERDLEQAAIELSLFLRDPSGRPMRIAPDRLPEAFPPEAEPDPDGFAAELAGARESHPLLLRLAFDRERLEVEESLARNELLPAVDLRLEGSRDLGTSAPGIDTFGKLSPAPRSDTEVKALVRFELPVQRREARGRLAVVSTRLGQLERRERFTRERIVANVEQAIEGIEASWVQTGQARENLRLAEQLRRAEERRLMLGLSNLIDVNIRELQAATAAQSLIDAQATYFRAVAAYEAAVADGS